MNALATQDYGDYRYEVYYDEDGYSNFLNDKEYTDEAKDDYQNSFDNEELDFFMVSYSKKCSHCKNYEFVDSVYGIIATDEHEALKQYLDDYGVN